MERFSLSTRYGQQMEEITSMVRQAVGQSKVQSGICLVYCPHTTAGIAINENADPDVVQDLLFAFEKTFPNRREFRHAEGNSAAHLKAVAASASVCIPIENGSLALGRWQGIYFCEFGGPRARQFYVQVLGGPPTAG